MFDRGITAKHLKTPIHVKTQKERVKFIYQCALTEEWRMKLRLSECYINMMLEESFDKLLEYVQENHPKMFRHQFKHSFNTANEIVRRLNLQSIAYERQDLLEIVAHGGPSLIRKYDKIGCLTSDINDVIGNRINRMLIAWNSSTYNMISKYTDKSQDAELIKLLYIANGWACIGISGEEAVYDNAVKMIGAANVNYNWTICNEYRSVLSNICKMIDTTGHKGVSEGDYWYEQANTALHNISRRLMNDDVQTDINQTILTHQQEYMDWFVSSAIVYQHENGTLSKEIKDDLKKHMTGKGEYVGILSSIRYYAKKVEIPDAWIFLRTLRNLTADKRDSIIWRFAKRATKWERDNVMNIEDKRTEIINILNS